MKTLADFRGGVIVMINLTQFREVKLVPNRRNCKCKNCEKDFVTPTVLPKGAMRVVASTGNCMPSDRQLSLCGECAITQAEHLERLARQLREAALGAYINREATA